MSTFHEIAVRDAIKLIEWINGTIQNLKTEFLKTEKDEERARERAEDYGSSVRTRARNFPELMESSGIMAAYTFIYAKATHTTYKVVCSSIDQNKPILGSNVGKEEFGYATLLHGILQFLEDIGMVSDHKEPGKAIEELWGAERTTLVSRLLLPYLMEMKKLSEALFKGE